MPRTSYTCPTVTPFLLRDIFPHRSCIPHTARTHRGHQYSRQIYLHAGTCRVGWCEPLSSFREFPRVSDVLVWIVADGYPMPSRAGILAILLECSLAGKAAVPPK